MATEWGGNPVVGDDGEYRVPDSGPVNRLEGDNGRPGEPVAVAELVRLAAAALAGLGWLTIPNDAVNGVATGVAAVVSIVATILARRRVTPVAK